MGPYKTDLDTAKKLTKEVDEDINWPSWLFHKLTDPMEGGALMSPDPFNGASGQMYQHLIHVKQRIEGRASQNALTASNNLYYCPAEA